MFPLITFMSQIISVDVYYTLFTNEKTKLCRFRVLKYRPRYEKYAVVERGMREHKRELVRFLHESVKKPIGIKHKLFTRTRKDK